MRLITVYSFIGGYIGTTESLLLQILYFGLSKRWPKLMKKWNTLDIIMKNNGYSYPKKADTKLRIILAIIIIAGMSIQPHFSILQTVLLSIDFLARYTLFALHFILKCVHRPLAEIAQCYLTSSFQHAYIIINYDIMLGCLIHVQNLSKISS